VTRPPLSILHVDLDAFYASVEQLADPSIAGRPVIVGGLGPRGVVSAASYEARPFGVHSAMPMAQARRACPHGVFLAPRFPAYEAASVEVMEILRAYTPLVEPLSLDEAFLDVAGSRRLYGDGPTIAAAIRARVKAEAGLDASVGVAGTKFLAKIASESAKPDGLLVVPPGGELDFLHPLPVERLWGVGPATYRKLANLGVHTVGDLAALPEPTLVRALGPAHGSHLHALAWNRDSRAIEPSREVKSIGHEETFPADVAERATLERAVVNFAEKISTRLRRAGKVGRTVQLKVRYHDFRTITRSRTLAEATDLSAQIGHTARELLHDVELGGGIRLLGVSIRQLESAAAVQGALPLDGAPESGDAQGPRQALERSVEEVRTRYGDAAVVPARLVSAPPGMPRRPAGADRPPQSR
jgi:DNA polymerase IV